MENEILTPKSEVDDYQTPHDCHAPPEDCHDDVCILHVSNEESNDSNNESSSQTTSQDTSENNSTSEHNNCDEGKFEDCQIVRFEDHDLLFDEQNSKLEEHNAKLEVRLKELKDQMLNLKGQLVEEKVAWQKELEAAMNVAKAVSVTYNNDQQLQASNYKPDAVPSTPYSMELVPKTDFDVESLVSEPTLSELTILDYEQKLATYQDALAKAQMEKRTMLKRQLAASAYKRRLLEVEKLCSMELMKVKQSVQFLQPLQALASSWENSQENLCKFDDELTGMITKTQNDMKLPIQSGDESTKSEFMTVEDFENTVFKDLKEFSSQLAATPCGLNLSEADDYTKKAIMTNWYNNELGSPFNPLM